MSLGSRSLSQIEQLAPVNAYGLDDIEQATAGYLSKPAGLERKVGDATPKLTRSLGPAAWRVEFFEQV